MILLIGHVTKDVKREGDLVKYIPGGGVFYGGKALEALGCPCVILTKYAKRDGPVIEPVLGTSDKVKLIAKDSKETTVFENIYIDGNADKRINTILSLADPFTTADISEIFAETFAREQTWVHISPLANGEFPEELILEVKMNENVKFLSTDAQGFIRCKEGIECVKKDWRRKEEFLKYFDMFKMDSAEAMILTGTDDILESSRKICSTGCGMVLFTRASDVSIYSRKEDKVYSFPFGDWILEGRTGRGDTTVASFYSALFPGNRVFVENPLENLDKVVEHISKVTTKKMQQLGPLRQY